jgi:menaquinol-cytochrome c reductase iron-sulfur subunit
MTLEPPVEGTATRRRMLATLVIGAASAIAATFAAVAARFLGGPVSAGTPAPIAVGPEAAFASGLPVEALLSYARNDAYRTEMRRDTIFVVRRPEGLLALSPTCTHLGCSVRWDAASALFRCPCHGGTYHPDGSVAGGPPPRPLARLPIEIRAGQVYVRPGELS